jgi:Helix-turn-helix domain
MNKNTAPEGISLVEKLAFKFALSVKEASAIAGIGRSQIYLALSTGALRAKKRGTSTLILPDDLRAWIDGLPNWSPSTVNCAPKAGGAGKAEKPPALKKRVLRPRQAVDAAPRRSELVAAE